MKCTKTILFFFFIYCYTPKMVAQNITVNDSYTAHQLVENILVDSDCANVLNPVASGDTFPVGKNSFGYFNNSNGSFPFKEGVVLSTWGAKNSEGPYAFYRGDGNDTAWEGDTDLDKALGIKSTNATVLEFDFIPLTNFLSFNYIFASNEYYEKSSCKYTDGFAFLIKEKGSTDNYKNLATIPGTTLPVSSTNIRPITPACPALNENYYNGDNIATSPINYTGQTIVMNAQTDVVAGKTYHIKLVIADDKNEYYDSAVFLQAGSFAPKIDLGPDQLIPNNPICFDKSYLIDTKLPADYSYKWYKDGITTPIPGETSPSYLATETGTYTVEVLFFPATCSATGTIKVEFTPEIMLTNTTLTQCDDNGDGITIFDLTQADKIIKNNDTSLSPVVYYESLQDAKNNINPILNPTAYINKVSIPILFARVTSVYNCANYAQLNLIIANTAIAPQNPITSCDEDAIQDGLYQFDLNTQVTPQLLNGLPSGMIVEYYLTPSDAVLQKNPLPPIFKNTTAYQQNIYARIVNGANCYGVVPVTLLINAFTASDFENQTVSICFENSKTLSVNSGYSSYLWSTGETSNSIIVSNPGTYSVVVTNENGCTKTKIITVTNSGTATITNAVINDFAKNENSVLLEFTGDGTYEFSLDGNYFQDNPLFTGLSAGQYWAYARDKNGCGTSLPYKIYILDYPHFFTPNGDGHNDTWEIKNLNLLTKPTVFIYDRYGKLLKQLNAIDPSWNGIYNGKNLTADDYWFQIHFENGKIIKGHFSLKR